MKRHIYNYVVLGISIILIVLLSLLLIFTNAIKHTSYDGLYSFIGAVVGGIATLITIFISTYLTLNIQDESNKFDINKIRIGIQIEAVQAQRIFITKVRIKYSELYYFITKSYNEMAGSTTNNIDLSICELEYKELLTSVEILENHFRNNEYILVKLYDHYSKLSNILKKIINSENAIKKNNNSHKLKSTLDNTATMLKEKELYTWLNDLEILMTDKYMAGVLEEEEIGKIKDNIHKWYL